MEFESRFKSMLLKVSVLFAAGVSITGCGGDDNNNNGSANGAPTVVLAETSISIEVGESVTLDASNSSDPEGQSLTFNWEGEGGTLSGIDSSEASVSDLAIGNYSYTVTVSDGENTSTGVVSVEVTGPQVRTVSKLDTGSMQQPNFVYFDLDAGEELLLTTEEAQGSSDWDVAFNRTNIYLNQYAETPVTLHFIGNTDDFYDGQGNPVVERFINATAETELAAFENFSGELPSDAEFHGDSSQPVINNFYVYDISTHTVSANDEEYYVISSNGYYARIRVVGLVQDGFGLASMTLAVALQEEGQTDFSDEQTLELPTAECTGDIFADLSALSIVGASDNWDITIPCVNGLGGFSINIAENVRALNGNEANVQGIDSEQASYLDWKSNEVEILAIKSYGDPDSNYGWAEYGVNGGHLMWPNFATYVIQTAHGRYKFQVLNYYDIDDSASGSFTMRYQRIVTD